MSWRQRKSRAALPVALIAAVSLALAACGADDDGNGAGAQELPSGDATGEFEFFSWWTGGGDSEGKEALLDLYEQQHPEVEVVDAAVAGGAGTNAQAVLASRLGSGDPPDSYQRHAGAELLSDIQDDFVEDISWLFDEEGWMEVYPEALLDQITVDGGIYSVPVNIHRSNLIWWNPDVLAEAGIDGPPASWTEFLDQAQTLESAGKTPLTVGPLWAQQHLLENVLLGELGPDAYAGLWTGETDWESQPVIDALDMFTQVLEYSNIGQAAADWQPAIDPIVDGDAAYNVMGDWAWAYFDTVQELEFGEGYGVTTSPGSEGVFNWLSDSFTLPFDAPHRDNAIRWLQLAGSKEGQDTFNPVKGSIPARTDADESLYTGYFEMPLQDWSDDSVAKVGSLAHGTVASNAWKSEIDSALQEFVGSGDSAAFASAVAQAYENTSQ